MPPEPVDECRQGLPEALTQLVMRCLEKEPGDRWQDASAIRDRLERIATPSGGTESVRVAAVGDGSGAPAARRSGKWILRLAVSVVAVVICLASVNWWLDRRTATRDFISSLSVAIEEGRYGDVYDRLWESGRSLAELGLADVAEAVGGYLNVYTEPAGADVYLVRVQTAQSFPAHDPVLIGTTPISGHPLVAGEYLMTLSRDSTPGLHVLTNIDVGGEAAIDVTLLAGDTAAHGMVWVDSGIVAVGADTISVRGFLIDRNEVTNARYLEFVAAGGYTDATLWDDTLVLDGTHLPWETAVSRLVDRTGLTGPRSWSGGGYSAGDDDHPVTGVSWYEAAAYARWKGKQLPSYEQWYRAALGDGNRYAPWGNDVVTTTWRANFNLTGVDPVGSYPLGVSPVGCFDMAGNVREWLVDLAPAGDRRLVVGGSWRDPAYMFEPSHMEPFDPWYAGNELGFRLATPLPSRQPDRQQR